MNDMTPFSNHAPEQPSDCLEDDFGVVFGNFLFHEPTQRENTPKVLLNYNYSIKLGSRELNEVDPDRSFFTEHSQILDASFRLGSAIEARAPHINREALRHILYGAIENAAYHGALRDRADVTISLMEEPSLLRATITNEIHFDFPRTLYNRRLSANEAPISVPLNERDPERTGEGLGIPKLSSALQRLLHDTTNLSGKAAALLWTVLKSEPKQKAQFCLEIPLS